MQEILTISQLTQLIKRSLETGFKEIAVQGEISNLKIQSSGHIYFTLKDDASQLLSVLFRGNALHLSSLPKDGDKVIARGEISVYTPRGQYQLIVRELKLVGIGELLLKFQQLKEELKKRGWFDPSHKKPLPLFPKRIGVITSPTGAVIQDILHILTRRFAGFHLILNPVKVQGEGSAREIAQAIYDFNHYELADVLIIGRGGGSLEDLWSFNEEEVAKAIFDSKIPIISAVGHETDFTLCDFVADVRAPTPSAAAEIVLKEKLTYLTFLENARKQLLKEVLQLLSFKKSRLEDVQKQPVFYSPYTLLGQKMQKLDDKRQDLDYAIKQHIEKKKMQLLFQEKQKLSLHPKKKLSQLMEKFAAVSQHIHSLNPKNLLKKGYSILFSEKENSIILSAREAKKGDPFYALMADGKIHATINQTDTL